MNYEIDYKPHAAQQLFHSSNARWRVLNCGRRWGKSKCAIAEAIKICFKKPKARGWVVAPTFPLVNEDWRVLFDITPSQIIKSVQKVEKRVEFINGSEIEFRSADNEGSLRGAGLDFAILDEAGRIKEDSWNALRPALSDKQGRGIFISTPKGKNWFYRMFLASGGNEPGYESWHFPSNSNPYFPQEEWDEAKANYPFDWFSQEFEANFLDENATIFRRIRSRIQGILEPYSSNKRYFAGVDLAKYQDFTVISILDENKHLCAFDRFNQMEWAVQKERIVELCSQYNADIWIDSTGVGDPIYEDLSHIYSAINGYKFTSESKGNLITALQISFEKDEITFPEIAVLIDELEAYEYKLLPSGRFSYNAPQGYHDDCVVSLALANWGIVGSSRPNIIILGE